MKAAKFPSNVESIRLVHIGDDRHIPGALVLKRAKAQKLDEVMVVGRADGELWAESSLNAGQSLWLLEKLREHILRGDPWSVI